MWSLLLLSLAAVAHAKSFFSIAKGKGCMLVVEVLKYDKLSDPNKWIYRPHAAFPVCDNMPMIFNPAEISVGNLVVFTGLDPVRDASKTFDEFTDLCIYGPEGMDASGVIQGKVVVNQENKKYIHDGTGTMSTVTGQGQIVKLPCHKPGANDFAGQRFGSYEWLKLMPNPHDAEVYKYRYSGYQNPAWNSVELSVAN